MELPPFAYSPPHTPDTEGLPYHSNLGANTHPTPCSHRTRAVKAGQGGEEVGNRKEGRVHYLHSRTFPHVRQWCLLVNNPNPVPHCRHVCEAESGSHKPMDGLTLPADSANRTLCTPLNEFREIESFSLSTDVFSSELSGR